MHTPMIRCLAFVAFLGTYGLSFAQNNLPAWNRLPECKGQDMAQGLNCFGSFEYYNGEKYTGQYKDGKRNGLGTYTWPDGQKYSGPFDNEDLHGRGTMTWADGSNYWGEFFRSKRHGQSIYVKPSSGMFVGEFVNDAIGERTVFVPKDKKIPMIEVINACETQSSVNFIFIATCIKIAYRKVGTSPDSQETRNFYRLLDGISEDANKKNIGIGKAKAELIKAWQSTIDASNKNEQANIRSSQVQPSTNNMAEQINQLDLQRRFDQTNRILESGKPCYPATNGTRICP